MRRSLLLVPALLLVGFPLSAQTDENVLNQQRFQDFVYRVTADPIDDSKTYFLATMTDEANSLGDVMTSGAGFAVVCYEGEPNPRVVVISSAYLAEEAVTVYYRFDRRDPVGPVDWQVIASSLENSTLAPTSGPKMMSIISEARATAEMTFRIEDNIDEGAQHTYSFSMLGISDGLERMPCID